MRLMRILIVLILCVKSLYRALPVQSKALENIDDQLFWQAAWFSEDGKPASPFTSDSKKITAKSIFITPNFVNQPVQYCPDGYRVDNGKCIKIISIQQTSEELLATRLASLITTDDTTNFDYDYDSFEDEGSSSNKNVDYENQEEIKLQLVPILHESNEDTDSNSNYNDNINAKNVTVKEYETTSTTTENSFITFHDFRTESKTDSVEVIITTLSNDDENNSNSSSTSQMMTYDHDNATIKPSADEFKVSSSTFSNHFDSTATAAPVEYENITEMNSNENETSVMQDRSNKDNQNVEPSFSLLLPMAENLDRENSTKNFTVIDMKNSSNSNSDDDNDEFLSNSTVLDYNENSQTEVAIIENSDTINFDDSSFLLNDSLIMIDNNNSSMSINSYPDYDDITTIDPFDVRNEEEQTTITNNQDTAATSSDNVLPLTTEQKLLIDENDDRDDKSSFVYDTTAYNSQNDDRQNDETNKFVYHHVPTSIEPTTVASMAPTIENSSVKGNKLKFPDEEINNRVRFPDDDYINSNNNNDEIATTSARIQSRLLLPSAAAASTRFSWPRENNNNNHRLTTNIFQFWNQQPLMNDFQRARENSKSFRTDNFFPYTRKVQIVTPQRYNFK